MAKTNQQIIVTEGDFGVEILTQFVDTSKKPVPIEGCSCKVKFAYNGIVISEKAGIVIDEPKGIVSLVLDKEETQYSGLWTSYWICYDQFNNVTTTENIYYYVQPAIGSINNPAFTALLNYYNRDEVNNMFKNILEQLNNYTLTEDEVEEYIKIYVQDNIDEDFIRQCILDVIGNVSDYVKKKEVEKINSQLVANTSRLGVVKSILEYKHLMTIKNSKEDWTEAIQQAIEDIFEQKAIKIVFPYGVYRITKSIKLGTNYMVNFEGEHSAFNGESLPSKTLASTIYLDVDDNDTPMFESKNGEITQIGGQITNIGFMSYKDNYYGKPKNIFMKNLRCAYRGFHLDRCLISQFKYVWYDCAIGGGTLIKNNQIRGIGKAIFSNTIIGDAQIFHNYFNGFMNDDGKQITYPDFIDNDRAQNSFSLSQINDNWFEFFRYVFINPTKVQFTGNTFDYCCRILDKCGFNVLFEGNLLAHSTKKIITTSIENRSRINNMFKNESYVTLNIWGSGVSVVDTIISYPLDDENNTYFMEIEGYRQNGTIKNIVMKGNNSGEFTLKPKYLVKNSNHYYVDNVNNLINLELDDYNISLANIENLDEIYPLYVIKNNRFKFSKLNKYFTPVVKNTNTSVTPPTVLQLIDDNGYPSLYANDNLLPKFSLWAKGGRANVVKMTDNYVKLTSNATGNVDFKYTVPITQSFYRFNSAPPLEGVEYKVILQVVNEEGKATRTFYPEINETSNEFYFYTSPLEKNINVTIVFASTEIGQAATFIRPSLTTYTDNPSRTIINGSSYNGNASLYAIKIKDGQLDCEEFFK